NVSFGSQIVLLFIAVQCFEADGKPFLEGISIQKGLEIKFKPFPLKPITFIKEKWSPFGVFGKKRAIVKRDTEFLIPVSPSTLEPQPAPVFENLEEIQNTPPLRFLPPQPPRAVTLVPVSEAPTVIITSSPLPKISPTQPPVVTDIPPVFISSTPLAFSSVAPPPIPLSIPPSPPPMELANPVTEPSISSNFIVPPPREGPPPGLFTDISRSEPVREYMDVVPSIPPTPPLVDNNVKPDIPRTDIVINDNALVRGSKLALYFGSIFLSLMSQFMTNARATFDQMTNPTPVFNN
ncbi:leucine-rich repeat extensin-like protein 3, partial [Trichoplusia ni]|uniref:Leucine-rich repeat extensin-like protein 3 n=1 Tax=Trichoplusia ni TaxID=7111 RepID=A0A7E5W8Y6_TRINI